MGTAAVRRGPVRPYRARDLTPIGVSLAVLVIGFVVFTAVGLRLNATASIPLGLYITTGLPPVPGLIAEFCPAHIPPTVSRRYRTFSFRCADYASPILKPIVAQTGDTVAFSSSGIVVNGRALPRTAPRTRDAWGHTLTPWPFGTYVIQPGHVVVASTYHAGSFDSRYFGPLSTEDIRSTLRPLWIEHDGPFSGASPTALRGTGRGATQVSHQLLLGHTQDAHP